MSFQANANGGCGEVEVQMEPHDFHFLGILGEKRNFWNLVAKFDK